jgi:hypothetical protein
LSILTPGTRRNASSAAIVLLNEVNWSPETTEMEEGISTRGTFVLTAEMTTSFRFLTGMVSGVLEDSFCPCTKGVKKSRDKLTGKYFNGFILYIFKVRNKKHNGLYQCQNHGIYAMDKNISLKKY